MQTSSTKEVHTTLIDSLLDEQKKLTAVEKFTQRHSDTTSPLQEPFYHDLIPIRKPKSGEQYSFAVDLDKCTGCKACVVACHSLNGLEKKESWRDVGTIRSLETNDQQTVTSACHHCADPACLNGCPVGAYEKMPDTGIVKHLDDQCIGCQYCSLKCPYDVPKYSKALGIVRKCDMCHDRLEEGEAPACVQSCPSGAITIKLVETESIYKKAESEKSIIAGAFRSDYTYPSTTYTSKRTLHPDMLSADEHSLTPSHKHTPLSWMLMLTQVAVGISLIEFLSKLIIPDFSLDLSAPLLILALVLGGIGLTASIFHLGSPLGAWRVFLGIKTSWLSREIILFGIWKPSLAAYATLTLIQKYQTELPDWVPVLPSYILQLVGISSILLGLLSVYCSIMVYVDTKRAFWSPLKTSARFLGTMLLGGTFSTFALSVLFTETVSTTIIIATTLALIFKIIAEGLSLIPVRNKEWSSAKKSALIQLKSLRKDLIYRTLFITVASLLLIASFWLPPLAILSVIILLIGEWMERQLYFQAVVTLKMPGNYSQ